MVGVNDREGKWFAVPLREGGGYAIGIVARASRAGILAGYFFGPRHDSLPTLADVSDLTPATSILQGRFGDMGLRERTWPILGRQDGWRREEWPMPILFQQEPLRGIIMRVIYDSDDPSKWLRSEVMPKGSPTTPEDGMMGAGFVESVLTRKLSS
ncbi:MULTISPECIES: Imm26 family immunity protein [unclassified Microbacterium]|uniref:Imm26 family immunity protein n=1 Tax=unclassified Microbacterium TaxID=2609290 RepID=UPI00109D1BD7|nr:MULTISPECIES: Imm26 family immunity protein [unclassified Microbacterium]